jgi:hypothetical protein
MAPVIRVDDEVYKALEGQVRGFGDSPNNVLRRLLKLDQTPPREPSIASQFIAAATPQARSDRSATEADQTPPREPSITSQFVAAAVSPVRFDRSAIEGTILDILQEHHGRVQIVDPVSGFNIYKEVATRLSISPELQKELTAGGEPRWRAEVGFARKNLEQRGIIAPTIESGRGVWMLTKKPSK